MAILTVTNDAGDPTVAGSLGAAIAAARSGDTIVLADGLAGSTIALSSTLAIAQSVRIVAPVNADGTPAVTLDGTNAGGPIMTIAAGANVSITGLAFANGNATGADGTDGRQFGAHDGTAGADTAGGILNAGNLVLSNVGFSGDAGTGGNGGNGANPYFGTASQVGGNGGNGGNGAGALYDEAGSSLTYASGSVTFTGDTGTGGYGGFAGVTTDGSGAPVGFFSPGVDGTASNDVGGVAATVTAPCFASGTLIRTPRGDVAVELLCAGDEVVLADGAVAPIVWVGHRRVHLHLHPAPMKVVPVRVRAGALGPNIPARDLIVSPDHALLLDGVLVPAGLLVNDVTIAHDYCERVVYHHVELARHGVLLAEAAPVESYLDTGNRMQFANCAMIALHPDFAAGPDRGFLCADMVFSGPVLDAIRARINHGLADGERRYGTV